MKSMFILAGLTLASAVVLPQPAAAVGCLSGAAVGGLGGHVVHHGFVGAVAGCAVGHHMAVQQRRQEEQQYYNQRQGQFSDQRQGNYDQGYSR